MVKKIITLILCFIIITNIIIVVIPKPVNAVMTPVVNIQWAEGQEVQEVDVSPGQTGRVTFSGTIRADLTCHGPDVYINLSGSTNQGWPVNVTPTKLRLDGGVEEKPISVTVAVTPETSHDVSGLLTVGGTASAQPGSVRYNIPPVTGKILIKQFFRSYMTVDRPSKQVTAGHNLVYGLYVNNIGNGVDSFEVYLEDRETPPDSELKIRFQNRSKIYSKGSKSIKVTVKTVQDTTPGKYEIKLNLKSYLEELEVGYSEASNLTLVVFVKDNYIYPISIIFTILLIIIFLVMIIKKIKAKIIEDLNRPEPPPRIPPID